MKEIKFLLKHLVTVVWTSSWWTFIILIIKSGDDGYLELGSGLKTLFALSTLTAVFSTIGLLIGASIYVFDNWKE